MFAEPQAEHDWLRPLLGEWQTRTECTMPDGSKHVSESIVSCRTLGGLWYVIEGENLPEDEDKWSTKMTLGYDPAANRYVGSFVGSMMTYQWVYEGQIDESGNRLVLDCEGPKFDGNGHTKFKDCVQIIDNDNWRLTSEYLSDDGTWISLMQADHVRVT